MAFATKYRIEGTSDIYGKVTINIKKDGYSGSVINLEGVGRDFVTLKIGSPSNDISNTILSGSANIQYYCLAEFQTIELAQSEIFTFLVEINDSLGENIWTGWVMPEEYSESYTNTPYVVNIVASDFLDGLKNVSMGNLLTTKTTLWNALRTALAGTRLELRYLESINIYSDGMADTGADSPLTQAEVSVETFAGLTCYDAINIILKPFFSRVYQYRGWRIENITEKRDNYVQRLYNVGGVYQANTNSLSLVELDNSASDFKAFIQKSGQLNFKPSLNSANSYFPSIQRIAATGLQGFEKLSDWTSTSQLVSWTNEGSIVIQRVATEYNGSEFGVFIDGKNDSVSANQYIQSVAIAVDPANNQNLNIQFDYKMDYPSVIILGTKPILNVEFFLDGTSNDYYWTGTQWVIDRRYIRISASPRNAWRNFSANIGILPEAGDLYIRIHRLVKSGTTGTTKLFLTKFSTNIQVEAEESNVFLYANATSSIDATFKGPAFEFGIADGLIQGDNGVMEFGSVLTDNWTRKSQADNLPITSLFLLQWLSFHQYSGAVLQGTLHQRGEHITPVSTIEDDPLISTKRYVLNSWEMSLGRGVGSVVYREIPQTDVAVTIATGTRSQIDSNDYLIPGIPAPNAPSPTPVITPQTPVINFETLRFLNGDVTGDISTVEITPAAIQNKARLDLTGLTADDIVLGAVKDSPDQENMTNLRLSDIKPLVSVGAGAGLSIDGAGNIQLGNDGAGVVDISDDVFGGGLFINGSGGDGLTDFGKTFSVDLVAVDYNTFISASASDLVTSSTIRKASIQIGVSDGLGNIELEIEHTDDPLEGSYAIFRDQINSKGLEYADDYSANWTDHSLVTKSWVTGQISGSAHNPVTIGSPANGLSIDASQVLTIGLASTSATGALSSTDWNTFNNKLNLTSLLTGYTVGANTALAATDSILDAFGKVQGQINARISGTIASGQVAFGTGANTVGGSANLTWDGTNLLINSGTFLGGLYLNGSSSAFRQVRFAVDDVVRWADNVNQNNYLISRYNTSGGFVNNPISINSSSGFVGINDVTSPTNTLDVNGTARIRTISNLGTAATSVLVPDATGVVSLRTATQFLSDAGGISGTIASGQVAFGTGVNTVGGSANLTWDGANLLINSGTFLGGLYLNGSSSAFRQVRFAVDDVVRWADNVNQNNYLISRYNTSGGFVNNPISINSSSGFVGINDVTSPTNTLDVNGTARIRTISNLGTAATSVLVPSATGVVSLRTLAEFASDAGLTNFWTLTGSDIYRNSAVAIGRTTIPTNATLAIQSLTSTSSSNFFQLLKNDGSSIFNAFEGNYMSFGQSASPILNGFVFRGNVNNLNRIFRIENSSGLDLFDVFGSGEINIRSPKINIGLASGGNTAEFMHKATVNTVTRIWQIRNSSNSVLIDVFGNGQVNTNDGRWNLGTFATPANGLTVRGTVNNNGSIFRLANSTPVTVFDILGNGSLVLFDGGNIQLGTSTGTRIGTTTNQKLAFWNAAPIVQPTTAVASGTLVSNAGTTLTSTDTIDGYTLQQVVRALRNTGLLA